MDLTIKKSKISGKGVFANKNFKKGDYIYTLKGEECTSTEIEFRIKKGVERQDDPLQIDKIKFLDINDDLSYHFNHSCSPSTGLRNKSDLYALENIKKGEEITFDYSATVSRDMDWKMNCNCKSKNCRKVIGNILSVPDKEIKLYYKNNCLQDFIKRELKLGN